MLGFPREDQENLICDILARDNEGLHYLASDITAFLLYSSKDSRIRRQITPTHAVFLGIACFERGFERESL